jgi:lipid-A-disaccharide synthase
VRPRLSRQEAAQKFGLDPFRPVIGLLPGSRRAEVERLLPVMGEAAVRLHGRHPEFQFILPVAPTLPADFVDAHLPPQARSLVTRVEGQSHEVMKLCNALLIASGTATLEAAVVGTPMAIVYRTNALTYAIARHLVRIRHIGLPNIIAGEAIVQEFLQDAATPDALAAEIERLVGQPEQAQAMRAALAQVRERLGAGGAIERLADLAQQMLKGRADAE